MKTQWHLNKAKELLQLVSYYMTEQVFLKPFQTHILEKKAIEHHKCLRTLHNVDLTHI